MWRVLEISQKHATRDCHVILTPHDSGFMSVRRTFVHKQSIVYLFWLYSRASLGPMHILDLRLRKTRAGKSHYHHDVIV